MTTILAFIIVLGVLVFFHELGHFLVARLCGVGVEIFSLGFGPRVLGRTVGRTDYRVSAVPLGGFVKMVGEEPDADIPPEDIPASFTHKNVYKRIMIVAAGPLFNLLLAVLIFYVIFLISGTYIRKAVVGTVTEESPAATAGLQEGDRIAAINGMEINTWKEMSEAISTSGGKHLALTIERNDSEVVKYITPKLTVTTDNIFQEEQERYVIGITAGNEFITRSLGPVEALGQSLERTWFFTELTVMSVVKLIQGNVQTRDALGGPIMIAQMAGEQARAGTTNLVFFIALLSINLAILNFLPIPVLDGGHLLFFSIEAVTGKPVNTRVREVAQQAGIFVLLLLMIFVFYNDISRILSSS